MGNMKPIDSALVKNETYDVLSADTMGGEYIETIGATCQNPDGYTSGSLFLGKDNDVQHLYRATAAIAFGETIILDTNCAYTTVSGELEGKAEESEVSSLNEALTNEVATRAINGAHNFAPITNVTQEIHGVTFTVGDTVKISGTPDTNVTFRLTEKHHIDVALKGKECKLHYDNSKGDMLYMWIEGYDSSNTKVLDKTIHYNALDTTFTIPSSTQTITIAITVRSTYDGALFDVQPMLILASDPSPAVFTPYAMTNRELTDATYALRTNATNRTLYSNSGSTFVSDSSITLSDNGWTLIEIIMYTNNISSGSRSVVLVDKNHIGAGPYIPMIDNSDRTKMAYFRPISYQNKVLSFQSSCPIMIIDVRPII